MGFLGGLERQMVRVCSWPSSSPKRLQAQAPLGGVKARPPLSSRMRVFEIMIESTPLSLGGSWALSLLNAWLWSGEALPSENKIVAASWSHTT